MAPEESISPVVLKQNLVVESASPDYEIREIARYFALEAKGETITHIEKVSTHQIGADTFDIWDVRTDKDRYWHITNLHNFYEQSVFPSMDMCLSFHVGYMTRLRYNDHEGPDAPGETMWRVSRQLRQASSALDTAREVEDFQAIGLRVRETLLTLVRELAADVLVAEDERPKLADFNRWSQLIISNLTSGATEPIRGYLVAQAKELWQVTNVLTHTRSAESPLARMVVGSAYDLLSHILTLLRTKEKEPVEKCPACRSQLLFREYKSNFTESWYILRCTVCDWERLEQTETNG